MKYLFDIFEHSQIKMNLMLYLIINLRFVPKTTEKENSRCYLFYQGRAKLGAIRPSKIMSNECLDSRIERVLNE
jgi:hypothetical protein